VRKLCASAALLPENRAGWLTDADAAVLVWRHYRLRGRAQRLAGERDDNFRITSERGEAFLLKVVHPSVDPAVANLHTQALRHVACHAPDLPVQRVIPDVSGEPECRIIDAATGEPRTVRLVSYLPGRVQSQTPSTPAQRRNAGAMLADMQLALQDFSHPADTHDCLWDLGHARSLQPMLAQLPEQPLVLAALLDDFADTVLARLPQLRTQVVHNDWSRDNLLVDPQESERIVGVIDFGDMVRTPVLFDVAVGAAYQLPGERDPGAHKPERLLAAACDFIAGFHARRALLVEEVELLFVTILARQVMRIVMTEWRAARCPENRAYLLRNTAATRTQLACLCAMPPAQATDAIVRALSRQGKPS